MYLSTVKLWRILNVIYSSDSVEKHLPNTADGKAFHFQHLTKLCIDTKLPNISDGQAFFFISNMWQSYVLIKTFQTEQIYRLFNSTSGNVRCFRSSFPYILVLALAANVTWFRALDSPGHVNRVNCLNTKRRLSLWSRIPSSVSALKV